MLQTDFGVQASSEKTLEWAAIKFGLLAEGARVTETADRAMQNGGGVPLSSSPPKRRGASSVNATGQADAARALQETGPLQVVKRPLRTRSGVAGGLDITIGGSIDVNVPIRESFARQSSFELDYVDDQFLVVRHDTPACAFVPRPQPSYYGTWTSDGTEQLERIGQMCSGDRFCYGMTGPTCWFWKKDRRCRYCSIGQNYSEDAARKQATHMLEALEAAVADENLPARHVLIGGGTPPGADMGALMAADLTEQIKSRFPQLPIYVMIAAPLENRFLDLLQQSGADEVGLNVEFWTQEAWETYIPGKHREIGMARYLSALEYCVDLFGPINTRSILISGLEPLEATYEGAVALADMGVMPIISPFRPLSDTMLADHRGPSGDEYVSLWDRLDRDLAARKMPLGPTCVACQNNTLALPTDLRYRTY